MSTCFDDHMLLYSPTWMFTCVDDLMLSCLHFFMITCPLTCIPSCSYTWTLWWEPAPMFKCFDDCMLTCIDIHTHVYTHGSWNVYRLGGISARVVRRTCTQMVWRLCLIAEEIRRLEVCVLGYSNAQMLICLYAILIKCLYTLMLKCSHWN